MTIDACRDVAALIRTMKDDALDPEERVGALWQLFERMGDNRISISEAFEVLEAYWTMDQNCLRIWAAVLRVSVDPDRSAHEWN
jgi:hypothetical protein